MILPEIENRIFILRGVPVMIDRDLSELYQIETKYINRAIKRNPERFPDGFTFRLTLDEFAMIQDNRVLDSNFESFKVPNWHHRKIFRHKQ